MDIDVFRQAAGLTAPRAHYWWEHVERAMQAYEITEPWQQAAFIAQASHESARFTRVVENLNYSATRLPQVFKAFRDGRANAADYAHQPEKLANFIYADVNRAPHLRLGNVEPGDGWNFRGRGLFQITGRFNYARQGELLALPLLEVPEFLEEPEWAAKSAAAYWVDRGCNRAANFDDTTRIIAGPAEMGATDRMMAYERAIAYLG